MRWPQLVVCDYLPYHPIQSIFLYLHTPRFLEISPLLSTVTVFGVYWLLPGNSGNSFRKNKEKQIGN
jgi:hypothetical protein